MKAKCFSQHSPVGVSLNPNFGAQTDFKKLKIVCGAGAVPASPGGSEVCAGIGDSAADGGAYPVGRHRVCESQGATVTEDPRDRPCESRDRASQARVFWNLSENCLS